MIITGSLRIGFVTRLMLPAAFLTLVLVGCHRQDSATAPEPAPAASATPTDVTRDECWHDNVKQAAQGAIEDNLAGIFASLKGTDPSFNELAASPRTFKTESFGVKSLDDKSGHVVCDTWITVTITTKHFGTIVVPATDVVFDIMQTEDGRKVSLKYDYFTGFMENLRDQLKPLGLTLLIGPADAPTP